MIKHEWRESLPGGDVKYITAKRHGRKWQFQTCLKSDDDWTPLDSLPLEDLQQLRTLMWNKYQRKRIPYEHVLEVDAMIEECEEAAQEEGADQSSAD